MTCKTVQSEFEWASQTRAGLPPVVSSVVVAAVEVIGLRLRLVSGIPVFPGFRESDAWWDSSFRSSAQPGSRS